MRNKASLSLMEQLVMILVFALAAALCLGVFAKAQTISQTTQRRETAAQIAQNGAELLKAGNSLVDLPLPEGYSAQFIPEEGLLPQGVAVGQLQIAFEGETVFSLSAAWQEDIP